MLHPFLYSGLKRSFYLTGPDHYAKMCGFELCLEIFENHPQLPQGITENFVAFNALFLIMELHFCPGNKLFESILECDQ